MSFDSLHEERDVYVASFVSTMKYQPSLFYSSLA